MYTLTELGQRNLLYLEVNCLYFFFEWLQMCIPNVYECLAHTDLEMLFFLQQYPLGVVCMPYGPCGSRRYIKLALPSPLPHQLSSTVGYVAFLEPQTLTIVWALYP